MEGLSEAALSMYEVAVIQVILGGHTANHRAHSWRAAPKPRKEEKIVGHIAKFRAAATATGPVQSCGFLALDGTGMKKPASKHK